MPAQNLLPTSLQKHFDETASDFIEFANELREECRVGYDSLLEQQEMLDDQFEFARLDEVLAFNEEYLKVETIRLFNQVFTHLHTQWLAYEKLARSLVGTAHLIDEPAPDKGLTEALLFD
ncbi:hypothetical protein [Pseudomonas mediterranea]|uniref:hypothetical protein n=1 Tax=Pseudomonas mediterranea TaxID=183795 RepID=UPI001D8E3AF2|nr:hypothetical protein [Pseudomonas mediterranea]CAH0157139.1 hypothetical protein SRABI112_00835 [Pseudomonas mediterranea]